MANTSTWTKSTLARALSSFTTHSLLLTSDQSALTAMHTFTLSSFRHSGLPISRYQQNAAKIIRASRSTHRLPIHATTPAILHYELPSSFFPPLVQTGITIKQPINKQTNKQTKLDFPLHTVPDQKTHEDNH